MEIGECRTEVTMGKYPDGTSGSTNVTLVLQIEGVSVDLEVVDLVKDRVSSTSSSKTTYLQTD